MPWPPSVVCRRIALVIFGLSLMLYTALSGLLFAFGLDARATVIVGQFTVLFGLSLWLARLMRLPIREAFALRPAGRAHWYMVFVAALPLQVAGGAMQYGFVQTLPDDSPWRRLMEQVLSQFIAIESPLDLLMLFLAAVATAAICEEFLFRGLLLHLMRRRAGWISAIIWSSVMFALYHLNPLVLLPITLVGAYLAILVWRSGSLYPAIVAHALNNGLALFGLPYIIDETAYAEHFWLILGTSSALFGAIVIGYLRLTPTPPDDRDDLLGSSVAPGTPIAHAEPSAHEQQARGQQLERASQPPATRGPGVLEGDGVDGRLGDGE